LFFKLRKNKEFIKTFKSIFNEEYNVLEIPKKPIQELINEIIKKNPELKKKTVKKVLSKKQTIEQKDVKQHTTAV
jgi:histone H3/H4